MAEDRTGTGAAGADHQDPGAAPEPGGIRDPGPTPRAASEAVFVVGLPRSGTTLMRRVLNSHSQIAIAGENNYLGNQVWWRGARHRIRSLGDLHDDATTRRLVDLLYSPEFQGGAVLHRQAGFWEWLVRNVPRDALERDLLAGERSERGVFEILLRTYAAQNGKPVFGEKTPAHHRWVDVLLEWFPRGRVVHMLRDPRAVYRSQLKRLDAIGSAPYRVLRQVPPLARILIMAEVAWAWSLAVDRHGRLAREYPDRYLLVRFEDLVRSPASEIRRTCAFLGVELEPAMLDQHVVSRGDRLGSPGFDAGAADRWRDRISSREAAWLRWFLGRRPARFGYPER
jgi:hypothetical protein